MTSGARALAVLRGMLTGGTALVGLVTLLALLDRVSWVFEMFSVFRLQYAFVLLVAAFAAVALRRVRLAAVAAALAALNVVLIGAPFAAPAEAAVPHAGRPVLRLLVVNVEVGNQRFGAVRRVIKETEPDVVGVVELTPAWASQLRHSLAGYHARRIVPRADAYGIGVYSRVPLLSARVEHFPADGGPPTIVARVRAAGKPVTIVVTHVHTPFAGSIHTRQLEALADARPRLGSRLAICGDFNTVPWAGPFRELAAAGKLADLYAGYLSSYSWPTWNPFLRAPLDNCLLSGGLGVTSYRHGPNVGSDHFPLVVDLAVTAHAG